MNNLDYVSRAVNSNVKLNADSARFAENDEDISTCVSFSQGGTKYGMNEAQVWGGMGDLGSTSSPMVDSSTKGVKNLPKSMDDKYLNSPKEGVRQNLDAETTIMHKTPETSEGRLKLNKSGVAEPMCEGEDRPQSRNLVSVGLRTKSVLDILMNRENCLEEIDDNLSEVYHSLTSSVNRFETCVSSVKEEDFNEDDRTSTTTDFEPSVPECDISVNQETYREEATGIEESRDPFELLIKCIVDREYLDRSQKLPPLFLDEFDEEKLRMIVDSLKPALEMLTKDHSFLYRAFVVNIGMQSGKEVVEKVYEAFVSLLKTTSSNQFPFGTCNSGLEREEQMLILTLESCIEWLGLLNREELLLLFKELFGFFFNQFTPEGVSVKSLAICKKISKRLKLEEIRSLLKFVGSNFSLFNSNLYSRPYTATEGPQGVLSTQEESREETGKEAERKKEPDADNLSNECFVSVIVVLLERTFVIGTESEESRSAVLEEAYAEFKRSLREFVEEALFKESVGFRNYKVFLQILLRNLERPSYVFTPFIVLEVAKYVIENINRERLDKEEKKEREFRIAQSLKLVLVIASHAYKLYHRLIGLEFVKYHDTKYLDVDRNKGLELDSGTVKNLKYQGLKKGDLREALESYVNYISISGAELNERVDGLTKYVFYALLKWHCCLHKAEEVEDLRVFFRVFEYLHKSNRIYEEDVSKIVKNLNFENVLNYPFTQYASMVEGFKGVSETTEETLVDQLMMDVYAYYILWEFYEEVMDSVVNVLYSTNENGLLTASINFVSSLLSENSRYIENESVRSLLMVSLSDYNLYVRQKIIEVYGKYIVYYRDSKCRNKKEGDKENWELSKIVNKEVVNKLLLSTKDVNYKIRLESVKVLHMFLSVAEIGENLEVVGVLAQRSLEAYREHPAVKKALYNLLGSVILIYAIENIESKTTAREEEEEAKMEALEKIAKVILYKMESYKGKINPISIIISYYESNKKIVMDPFNYYKGSQAETSKKRIKRERVEEKEKEEWEREGKGSEEVVNRWLEHLLDLFLYKRAKGANYYELAEVLSVFKLFGEVYPRLFLKHLTYFLPYLKIVNDSKMDVNHINLIILINNLIIIIYKYINETSEGGRWNGSKGADENIMKELTTINNTVGELVNYNSPILIRSIIQMLSYNNGEWVKKIEQMSYDHLVKVKTMLESENIGKIKSKKREKLKDEEIEQIRINIVSGNRGLVDVNVYKSAWQLGCVCEFNKVDLKVLKLFAEMFKLYNDVQIYNISGLFTECVCRYLSNIDNLRVVRLEELRSVLRDLYEYSETDRRNAANTVLILYQLLNTYQILTTSSAEDEVEGSQEGELSRSVLEQREEEVADYDDDDERQESKEEIGKTNSKREVVKVIYIVVQRYLSTFIRVVTESYEVRGSERIRQQALNRDNHNDLRNIKGEESRETEKDKYNTEEVEKGVVKEEEYKVPEERHEYQKEEELLKEKDEGRKQIGQEELESESERRRAERDRRGLYMEIIEIIVVHRLTSFQEIVPFVFVQLMSSDRQVQRIAEHNLKLIIKNDLEVFVNRLTTCFTSLFYSIVEEFFEGRCVLGVTGGNTNGEVQSILRIYLEVLQVRRSNVKVFVNSLLLQTKVMMSQETVGTIERIVRRNGNFEYQKLEVGRGKSRGVENTLRNIIGKIKSKEGEEQRELVVEYFIYLYANLICVILDGLSFKNRREANLMVARIQEVVNDNNRILSKYEKITNFVKARLKRVEKKIKNIYK